MQRSKLKFMWQKPQIMWEAQDERLRTEGWTLITAARSSPSTQTFCPPSLPTVFVRLPHAYGSHRHGLEVLEGAPGALLDCVCCIAIPPPWLSWLLVSDSREYAATANAQKPLSLLECVFCISLLSR